jgi:hypothetical protein
MLLWLSLACQPAPTPEPELPPAQTDGLVALDTAHPLDIGDLLDSATPPSEPEHTVTIVQQGWLVPEADPPIGALWIEERPDDWAPPADTARTGTDSDGLVDTAYGPIVRCAAEWTLEGIALESTCDGCESALIWVFTRVDPDRWSALPRVRDPLDGCADPDRPGDGARYVLAWNPATGTVDRQIAGVWLPWFHGERSGAQINLEWTGRFGVVVEEEE